MRYEEGVRLELPKMKPAWSKADLSAERHRLLMYQTSTQICPVEVKSVIHPFFFFWCKPLCVRFLVTGNRKCLVRCSWNFWRPM